jgi:excisionase family DNA binding protein
VRETGDTSGLLTAEQVAKRLTVSDEWVYQAARRGAVESVRVGGLVRFRPESGDEFIDSHTRTAA